MAVAILNTEAVIASTGPGKQRGPEGKKEVGGNGRAWERAVYVPQAGVSIITMIYTNTILSKHLNIYLTEQSLPQGFWTSTCSPQASAGMPKSLLFIHQYSFLLFLTQ